jgi:hypothetical protein
MASMAASLSTSALTTWKSVAGYLRFISEGNEGAAKFWTMPEAKDCAEWTLPVPGAGTVLALAKHIDPGIRSSILYQDLARAIDGGQDATEPEMNKSLLGCGTHGGQYGVIANLSDPLYHTDEYKDSGAKPEGILVKLVNAPAQVLGQQTGEL